MRIPAFGRKLGLDVFNHSIRDCRLLVAGSVHIAFAAVFEMFADASAISTLPNNTSGISGTVERGMDTRDVSESGEKVRDSRWSRLWLNALLVQA